MRSLTQKPRPGTPNAPRIRINRPGDLHEQEASRVADDVTREGTPRPRIARPTAPGSAAASAEHLLGPGRALDSGVRTDMERRFGHDFSKVRIHADAPAAESARGFGANAYTTGSNIVFGEGRFRPATPQGRRLLAHELTHVVQRSMAPGGQRNDVLVQREPPAGAAPAPAADAPAKQPANVRESLAQLFDEFEKKIVGDPIHDKIITRKSWMEEKVAEEDYPENKKKYDKELEDYKVAKKKWEDAGKKKGEEPKEPVAPRGAFKFTTCIATQQALLKEAFKRAGIKMKPIGKIPHFDYGPLGKKNAETIGEAIWHEAKPNMPDGERPKPGDIIVLAKRGESVDKAAKNLFAFKRDAPKKIVKANTANDAAQEALKKAEESLEAAEGAVKALEEDHVAQTSASAIKARGAVAAATIRLGIAKGAADRAYKALETEKNRVSDAEQKLDKARSAVDHSKWFFFSHVGFVKSITKNGDGSGSETWMTFDGGQTVMSRKPNAPAAGEPKDDPRVVAEPIDPRLQGTESVKRTYFPKTNEISGEKSQGGDARWLYGWVDVDKLVEGS